MGYLEKICLILEKYPQMFLLAFFLSCFMGVGLFWAVVAMRLEKRKEKKLLKKQAKRVAERRLQFALPDRENSFVRERLQQVLDVPEEEPKEYPDTYFQFVHVQKLLNQLAEQKLSTAERLELMDMNAFLGASLQQKRWRIQEIRAINDCFCRVLKLAAKYAVEV